MSRFKVGDYVVFHPERVTKITPETDWQFNVPTTPMEVLFVEDSKVRLKDSIFTFHERWLEPAKCEFREKGIGIKNVIFSGPATIVFFTDGSKEVVKCDPKDRFDPEKGIALACARKLMGGDGYYAAIRGFVKKWEKDDNFDDMSTEGIRQAVWAGCRKYPTKDRLCFEECPCSGFKTRTCVVVSTATRKELIAMLKAFRDNGDWRRF